ncbi:MAG: hypothetical protein ACYDCW_14525 [Acidithiobacillus ferrivorans]|jgi:hypothetical protein
MDKIDITIPEALEKIKEKQEHAMTVCTSPPLTPACKQALAELDSAIREYFAIDRSR